MPGPFPGVDPYLEGSDFWTGFHNRFLMYVADDLQPQLPANYVATVEVRIYLENPEGGNGQSSFRMPDLEVIRVGPSSSWSERVRVEQVPRGGVLVAPDLLEQREAYVLVRDLPSGELVASLELLSPANKRRGEGREQYRRKQQQLVAAGVNLVEIDLLRGGSHTTLPREEALLALPPFHYLASIYRAADSEQCQVFTWSLRDPLPEIPVPLASEDAEPTLDLQSLFERTYDQSRMRRLLPYGRTPQPPLTGDDVEWADRLLGEAGLKHQE